MSKKTVFIQVESSQDLDIRVSDGSAFDFISTLIFFRFWVIGLVREEEEGLKEEDGDRL